jgi:flagellar P-ring protein precursor FlgI
MRDNQLIGYGLVVGLAGKGDSARSELTRRTIRNLIGNMGIGVDGQEVLLANSAVVMVTATLGPFAREGERIDVMVSSIADARALTGGVLLQTPLRAADGKVYAVAQGGLLVGGTPETTLNVGRVPRGAIVELAVGGTIVDEQHVVRIVLRERDFKTMDNVQKEIVKLFPGSVRVEQPGVLALTIPEAQRTNTTAFLARIETLEVEADLPARVVVDGKSGTIVMGENVRIGSVAVSYNGIRISVGQSRSRQSDNSFILESGADVKSLIGALNKVGARPADIINILQAIERSGALMAQLIIM